MPAIKRDSEEVEILPHEEPDSAVTFGGCDLLLFRSGRHSDTIIKCGDKSFPVHKAILWGRCGWFREAIKELGEAPREMEQMPLINVNGHEPRDVEAILIFIYSGEIDPGFFDDHAYPTACIRLYDLGHKFDVTNLADFGTTELGNYLSNVLKSICDQRLWKPAVDTQAHRRTEIQDQLRRANFIPSYVNAIEFANRIRLSGKTDTDRLRPYQMLVDFFVAGEVVLNTEPDFIVWLGEEIVPAFGSHVLLTKNRGGCRSKWMHGLVAKPSNNAGHGRQGLCVACHSGLKNIKQCGGAAFANPRSWKGSYTEIVCKNCVEKESSVGEDGFPKWDVFNPRSD